MVRTPLKQGEIIQLNNRQYTIDKVIGDGATCIVYSAYYSDSSGHPHHVNIKSVTLTMLTSSVKSKNFVGTQ